MAQPGPSFQLSPPHPLRATRTSLFLMRWAPTFQSSPRPLRSPDPASLRAFPSARYPSLGSSSEGHINITSWRTLPWSPTLSQGPLSRIVPTFCIHEGACLHLPHSSEARGSWTMSPRLSCSRLARHTVGAPRANGNSSQVRLQQHGSWPKGRPGAQPRSASPQACDPTGNQADTRQTDGQMKMPSSISSSWDSVG